MTRLNVELEPKFFERFKDKINERYGGIKKGDLAKAVIEAIELWLAKKS